MNINSISDVDKFFDFIKQKSKDKFKRFIHEFTQQAIAELSTVYNPLGDAVRYKSLYESRFRRTEGEYLPIAGLSSNNWITSLNTRNGEVQQNYSPPNEHGQASINYSSIILSSYELGDTIYVQNNVDYVSIIGGESWIDQTVKNQSAVEGYFRAGSIAAENVNSTI